MTAHCLGLSMVMAALAVEGPLPARAQQSVVGRGVGPSVAYPYGSAVGARAGATAGSGAAAAPGMYSNPYAVPTLNPFLNPYAALYAPANPQDAALYFFAAQQSMGGIGSGRLSGTRPAPAPAQASPIPADRRVSDTPGAGAARYFNRPIKGGGVPGSYYNRFGNYYSANGH